MFQTENEKSVKGVKIALLMAGTSGEQSSESSKVMEAFENSGVILEKVSQSAFASMGCGDFDGILISDDLAEVDRLRSDPAVLEKVRDFESSQKMIATLGHAPWLLASAGLAEGRMLTSSPLIQEELKNAGAHWVDQSAVIDHNWVTCRGFEDLSAFKREILGLLSRTATQGIGLSRASSSIINIAESA